MKIDLDDPLHDKNLEELIEEAYSISFEHKEIHIAFKKIRDLLGHSFKFMDNKKIHIVNISQGGFSDYEQRIYTAFFDEFKALEYANKLSKELNFLREKYISPTHRSEEGWPPALPDPQLTPLLYAINYSVSSFKTGSFVSDVEIDDDR